MSAGGSVGPTLRLYRQCAPVAYTLDKWRLEERPDTWYESATQAEFCETVLDDALCAQYPLRDGYAKALAKRYMECIEGDRHTVGEELTVWYVTALQAPKAAASSVAVATELDRGDTNWSHEIFTVSLVGSGGGQALDEETIVMRVAPQFSNVGLALWPSAFILCRYIAENVGDLSARVDGAPWRVLELGAGVSLTAIFMAKCLRAAGVPLERVVMTDYMDNILDNAKHCLALNQCSGDPYEVAMLDWTARDGNLDRIRQWLPNIIMCADVIYDADVLDDLAFTLQQCFATNGAAVCIMVATRRNEATSARFFDAIAPFADVANMPVSVEEPAPDAAPAAGSLVGPFYVAMVQLTQVFLITAKRP